MDYVRLKEIADQLKGLSDELAAGGTGEGEGYEEGGDEADEGIEEEVSPGIHDKVEEKKAQGSSGKPNKGKVNLMLAFLKRKGK